MDIDVIRSAPMCEETVLWFEFLLKPELLETFLKKESKKPQDVEETSSLKALELLGEFLSIPTENQQQSNEINSPDSDASNKVESLSLKLGRKHLALKILALKVASFLNWNLNTIEKFLPIQKQVQLLSDLCSITSGRLVNLPLSLVHEVPVSSDGNKIALNFALTLYHRWLLRAQVLRGSNTRNKTQYVLVITTPEQSSSNYSLQDENFIAALEPFTPTSIEFLNQIIADPEPFRMLTFDSFIPLDSSKADTYCGQKFEFFNIISKTELKAQIYYDLCVFNIFIKKYDVAKEMIILCRDNLEKLKQEYAGRESELLFCTITDEDLKGYLMACGIYDQKPSLFQLLNESILNGNKNIEPILNEDNYKREIPIIHRKTLEMEIDQFSADGIKIVALNAIRYVLDDTNILNNDMISLKYKNNAQLGNVIRHFVEYSNEIRLKLTPEEQEKIKKYLIDFLIGCSTIEPEVTKSEYFEKGEIDIIKKYRIEDEFVELSGIALQIDWTIPLESKIQRIDIGDFERKLVCCTTPRQVRKWLVELAKYNRQQPLWSINKNWFIPPEVRVVVLNLKRGFFQDFSYILLGKANEMVQKKDYGFAVSLLTELRNESKRAEWSNDAVVAKLGKLIDWEKMNVQIISRLENDWPKKPPTMKEVWSLKLKQMATTISNEMPRLEIVENVLLMLLNLNEFASCNFPDPKRSPIIELCSAFASMMLDFQSDTKNKNSLPRKRDFWDLVLPIFNTSNQQQQNQNPKRNQPGRRSSDSPARSIPVLMNLSVLKLFLDKLRDPLIITIMLSLISKMYNLLKDDSNMELSIENFHLWPMCISNANGYNIKSVSEALSQLLKLGRKMYPMNVAWIKLQGDLEFVNGNNESAMKYYVQSLIIATEYCSLPIQRPLVDEGVIKKMIKCSSNLGCYLQAAVLCQFMDEIDYTLAFKCLQEKSSNFQDAMDSYYSLIWDSTLLEYIINLHYKKGEHKRRLQAISYIRQLELNANNCDEVRLKAAAVRKVKFLRSLANQYM